MEITKEIETLFARLDDLIKRANHSQVGVSAFLSPRELHLARSFLQKRGCAYLCFGGYGDAERQRIYILPEYMESVENVLDMEAFGVSARISVIKACGSGFCKLSHRDFMGAVLGLGVERSVIGDIVIVEESVALIICDEAISQFLLESLTEVGRDKVKVSLVELGEDFVSPRKYAPISDTVASARLDCVVAALCSLSREKAREAVLDGLAEVDYETCEQPDKEVKPVCLISVRGYGKFRILSLSDKTKKGRYRLVGEKFL